jgi:hypothetical protein
MIVDADWELARQERLLAEHGPVASGPAAPGC